MQQRDATAPSDRHPLWQLLDGLQMDLRAADKKLVQIRSYVAGLNIGEKAPSSLPCPGCDLRGGQHLLDCPTLLGQL